MSFHVTYSWAYERQQPLHQRESGHITTYDLPLALVVETAHGFLPEGMCHYRSEIRDDDAGQAKWVISTYFVPGTGEVATLSVLIPEHLGASSRGRTARYIVRRI